MYILRNNKKIITFISVVSLLIHCNYLNNQVHAEDNLPQIEISEKYETSESINALYNDVVKLISDDEFTREIAGKLLEGLENSDKDVVTTDDSNKFNYLLGVCNYSLGNDECISNFEDALPFFEKNNDDNILFDIYYKIGASYIKTENLENAEKFYNKAEKIALKNNDNEKLYKMYHNKSVNLYFFTYENDMTKESIDKALDLALNKLNDNYKLADIYNLGGIIYNEVLDNKVQAAEYLLKSIESYEALGEKDTEVDVAINLAVLYMQMDDYQESAIILEKYTNDPSYTAELIPDAESTLFSTITTSYINIGEHDKARETIELAKKATAKIEEYDRPSYEAQDLLTEADLLSETGKGKEALEMLSKSRKVYNDNINTFIFYGFDMVLAEEEGDAYASIGDFDNAVLKYKEAIELANEYESNYETMLYYKKIALAYKGSGNKEESLTYFMQYDDLRNEFNHNSNRHYTEKMRAEFEADKKEEEIRLLKEQELANKRKLHTVSGIGLGLTAFALYAWVNTKKITRLNDKLKSLSITDGLTGISNRRALDEFINEQWVLLNGTNSPMSIIMIDIDCFKLYNDNYGHQMGDTVLTEVAQSINNSCLRKYDKSISLDSETDYQFVGRYGGEEFVVILLNTDKEGALIVAERIKENIAKLQIKHDYTKVDSEFVTLSMGVATKIPNLEYQSSELVELADKALYYSKESGRNKFSHIEDIDENQKK